MILHCLEVFNLPGAAWRRLLVWHVADHTGRCTGCHEDQGPGHIWPCAVHVIATKAAEDHYSRSCLPSQGC